MWTDYLFHRALSRLGLEFKPYYSFIILTKSSEIWAGFAPCMFWLSVAWFCLMWSVELFQMIISQGDITKHRTCQVVPQKSPLVKDRKHFLQEVFPGPILVQVTGSQGVTESVVISFPVIYLYSKLSGGRNVCLALKPQPLTKYLAHHRPFNILNK